MTVLLPLVGLVLVAALVYLDARSLAARGASVMPLEAALGCLLLSLIYLPYYLVRRRRYVRETLAN